MLGEPATGEEEGQLAAARRAARADKAAVHQLRQQGAISPETRQLIERDIDDRLMAAEEAAREAI